MVEQKLLLDDVFHALSHGARRDMLTRLAAGALTVGQLAEPYAMTLAATSKHLGILERAGLVTRHSVGRNRVCRLEAARLQSAQQWLTFYEEHWERSITALGGLFHDESEEEK